MIRYLTFILCLLSVPCITSAGSKEMSKRDQVLKRKFLGKLGKRVGYEGNKLWDNFIRMAVQYEDQEVMHRIFSLRPLSGQPYALYVEDLIAIFSRSPLFFLSQGNRFYNGNTDCLVQLLASSEKAVHTGDDIPLFLKKSTKTFPKSKDLRKFRARYSFYEKQNKKTEVLNTKSCIDPFVRKKRKSS